MRRLRYLWTWLTCRNARRGAAEIWVTANGDVMQIGEMSRGHLVNSLALIVRKARVGDTWYMSLWPNHGQLRHSSHPQFMQLRDTLIADMVDNILGDEYV